jgi:hypothetical protein
MQFCGFSQLMNVGGAHPTKFWVAKVVAADKDGFLLLWHRERRAIAERGGRVRLKESLTKRVAIGKEPIN